MHEYVILVYHIKYFQCLNLIHTYLYLFFCFSFLFDMYFCSLSSQNLLDVSFFFGFSGSLGDGCRSIHKTLILLLVVLSDIQIGLVL